MPAYCIDRVSRLSLCCLPSVRQILTAILTKSYRQTGHLLIEPISSLQYHCHTLHECFSSRKDIAKRPQSYGRKSHSSALWSFKE
jgi:hypothetical protein